MNDLDVNPSSRPELEAAILSWTDQLAPHGIFTTDHEMRITSWNHWLETHSLFAAEQVIGQPLLKIVPSLSSRRLDGYFGDALKGEVKIVATALHRYLLPFPPTIPNSGFTHMQQSARIAPLMLDGKIWGTITVIEDVTEREWQNRELRNEKERQELLSETLAHLLIARDPEPLVRDTFGRIAGQLKVDTYLPSRLERPTSRASLQWAVGCTATEAPTAAVLEKVEGYARATVRSGRPVILNPLQRSNDPQGECLKDIGLEAAAAFPLMVGDHMLGSVIFA